MNLVAFSVLEKLQLNHFPEWTKTRAEVEKSILKESNPFCICGRAVGSLHDISKCKKLQKKTNEETVKKLNHLIS